MVAKQQESPNAFRALLLEDHDFQRQLAAEVLRSCGASEVYEASDGLDALALMESIREPVDLYVCDVNMEGMDGIEFLRRLGGRSDGSSVIIVSAVDPTIVRTVVMMAQNYGVRIIGAVEKPLTPEKFAPLLARLNRQRRLAVRRKPDFLTPEEIKRALNAREFVPYFQPQVSLRDRSVVGMEALIRWFHPEHGMLVPAVFVPAMEECGLITAVTDALLGRVIEHWKDWRAGGLELPLSLNVSARSLQDGDLPERFVRIVGKAQFALEDLTLEVTETAAMTNLGRSLETLARLRMRGFRLSLDDYGTGFSSMQQLMRVPLNELKIDREFVTGATDNPLLEILLDAGIDIARRLKIRSFAEGVETQQDWDTVARMGCDVAQGFYIGRPMPGAQVPEWHETWNRALPA
jgi:EAL domain-containing protein (putative c-di-GMP-specific phosphodiesterase class I)/AmiR/NasT family two-component response regulator